MDRGSCLRRNDEVKAPEFNDLFRDSLGLTLAVPLTSVNGAGWDAAVSQDDVAGDIEAMDGFETGAFLGGRSRCWKSPWQKIPSALLWVFKVWRRNPLTDSMF